MQNRYRTPLWFFSVLLAFCVGFLLLGNRALASEVGLEELLELPLEDLMNIRVVSAARYEQKMWEAPSTIHVITQEDIRASGLTCLPDVLRMVPGLDVTALGATQIEVNARGLIQAPANKTAVLLDGNPLFNRAYNATIFTLLPFTIEDIERVEVVLGPCSALYGANAYTGVINIITKTPEEAKNFHVRGTLGSQHTYHQSLLTGGTLDRWGGKFTAGWDETDRWRNGGESGDVLRLRATLEYRVNETAWARLTGGYVDGGTEFFANPEIGHYDSDDNMHSLDFSARRQRLEIKTLYRHWLWQATELPLTPEIADNMLAIAGVSDASPALQAIVLEATHKMRVQSASSLTEDAGEGQLQYTVDPTDWCKLILGGDYRAYLISSRLLAEDAPESVQEWGGFAQAVLRPADSFSITLGGRYDHFQVADDRLSYRASLVYLLRRGHSIRAACGTAFRNPAYLENHMSMSVPMMGLTVRVAGNQDLEPESITTFEAGYHGSFWDGRIKAQATAFYSDIQDFIHQRPEPPSALQTLLGIPSLRSIYQNFGSARSWGGELDLKVRWTHRIQGFANYSYQDIYFTEDDLLTPENEDGKRSAAPKHKINAGLHLALKYGISSTLMAHYVGPTHWQYNLTTPIDRDLSGYLLVNARIGRRFWDDRAEVMVVGTNLLHDKHREFPFGDSIGTRILLSARLDF